MSDLPVNQPPQGVEANGAVAVGTFLPQGLHPNDRTGDEYSPVPPHIGQRWAPGSKPFATPNGRAIPVFQRAAEDWAEQSFTWTATDATTKQVAGGRERGRVAVTLWVPSSASLGCQFSRHRGTVDAGAGLNLNPGDSITLPTEGPVYVGPQAGQTTGLLYVVDLFNPRDSIPE